MYILGLDVGTTGTKARLINEKGEVLSGGYREYKLKSDGLCVTQNAEDWWDAAVFAVREATRNVGKNEIAALSMSTQAASMLCIDENGNVISDVITWMDGRSFKEKEYIDSILGCESVYKKTGWQTNAVLDASKILWIKNNDASLFAKTAKFITTVEFINMRLTGRCAIDYSNAAMRQIFNIQALTWDKDILSLIGITEEKLPEIIPTGECVGTLTKEAADLLGLCENVKVFQGAHDQYCASLGSGAVEAGDMLLATGTTWVVLGITDKILYTESHICPGVHPVKGKYGALSSLVSAGSALNWYKSIIGDDFAVIDEEAEKRMKSTENLFVLPYVCGAGFPHNRPDMRGAMFGLDVGHDKYNIARALMEGVAFEALGVLKLFSENGMNINTLCMTGGAARSRVWSEIVGYVTGCDIYRMKEPETCCIGAAMIAAVGMGLYKDFTDCKKAMVKRELLPLPDKDRFEFYAKKSERYFEYVNMIVK